MLKCRDQSWPPHNSSESITLSVSKVGLTSERGPGASGSATLSVGQVLFEPIVIRGLPKVTPIRVGKGRHDIEKRNVSRIVFSNVGG